MEAVSDSVPALCCSTLRLPDATGSQSPKPSRTGPSLARWETVRCFRRPAGIPSLRAPPPVYAALGCVYVLWAGGMSCSPRWNGYLAGLGHHGRRVKGLELVYYQLSSLVLEIPATFEYIDFEGPPDRLQITKIGGYPTGLGSEAGRPPDIISHIMALFGKDA
jgi:hypothetical protein